MWLKNSVMVAVVLALGFNLAVGGGQPMDVEGLDELTKQKGRFKTTLVHPEADFSRYGKVCVSNVILQFRATNAAAEPAMGSKIKRKGSQGAPPDWEDVVKLRQTINDSFADELAKSEAFQVVEVADEDTLLLQISFIDILSKIPPKDSSRYGERLPLIAKGKIYCDLIDAETGVIQARVGERTSIRRDKDSEEPEGGATLWTDVGGWAHSTAVELREQLESVRTEDMKGHVVDST